MNTLNHYRKNQDLSKLVQSLFPDLLSSQFGAEVQDSAFVPHCEVTEDEKGYFLSLEIPGVTKDSLKIEQLEQMLTITGERKKTAKSGNLVFTEVATGKFKRSFELPKNIDTAKIEAHYEDGVLTLNIPKQEMPKPREIKIGQKQTGNFFERVLKGDREQSEVAS